MKNDYLGVMEVFSNVLSEFFGKDCPDNFFFTSRMEFTRTDNRYKTFFSKKEIDILETNLIRKKNVKNNCLVATS